MKNVQENGERIVLRIGTEDVDFTDFPALTLGDRKRMSKEFGLDISKMESFGVEEEIKLTLFLVQKLRPKTTIEEIEAIPMKVAGGLAAHAMICANKVDSPFLKRSTTLQTPTGGPSATSENSPLQS